MERTEYLKLCQEVSVFPTVGSMKQNIPPKLLVEHNGITYYPYAYELLFNNGKTIHKAILHDIKTNSITYAELSKVIKKEVMK